MRKFTIAIISALIISASTSTVQACGTGAGIGALFVLQDSICSEDEGEAVKIIDGDNSDIEFTFKFAELIKRLLG